MTHTRSGRLSATRYFHPYKIQPVKSYNLRQSRRKKYDADPFPGDFDEEVKSSRTSVSTVKKKRVPSTDNQHHVELPTENTQTQKLETESTQQQLEVKTPRKRRSIEEALYLCTGCCKRFSRPSWVSKHVLKCQPSALPLFFKTNEQCQKALDRLRCAGTEIFPLLKAEIQQGHARLVQYQPKPKSLVSAPPSRDAQTNRIQELEAQLALLMMRENRAVSQ